MGEGTVSVAIALGSNLGDRAEHLASGLRRLSDAVEELRCSETHETRPMYVTDQPLFLNACCVGTTDLEPLELFELMKRIERDEGRGPSDRRCGPRELDLDLLFYGDRIIERTELTIPHPLMGERMFVLGPLAEIAPAWRHPATGLTVEQMKDRLERGNADGGAEAPGSDS